MNDFFRIGRIVKPQGVKGEVKVSPMTDDNGRFKKLKSVYIGGKEIKVLGAKISPDAVFLALFGITDRNAAEKLRGEYVLIKREDAVELKKDSYFIEDLIGMALKFEDEEAFAKITDVIPSKTDVIVAESVEGKVLRFPFLKDALISVNVEAGVMTLEKKRFGEICCYED